MGCVPSMRISSKHSNPPELRKEPGASRHCSTSNGTRRGSKSTDESPVVVGCNSHAQGPATSGDAGFYSKVLQMTEEGRGLLEESKLVEDTSNGLPNGELSFGAMRLQQQTMSVLLVFQKKDAQCEAFAKAASNGGYHCSVVHTAESALHSYFEYHHKVILIDTRPWKGFDALELCSHIRATHNSEHTVIVALRPQGNVQPPMLTLIKAGFNRQFIENLSTTTCLDELQSMEHGEVTAQTKLKAAQAFMTAVDNCSDAVEIMAESHEIQYVNPTFERLFGTAGKEVIGKRFGDLSKDVKTKPDVIDSINTRIQNGKHWDGVYQIWKQNGEALSHKCRVFPVLGQSGKVCHLVALRNLVTDPSMVTDHSSTTVMASSPVGDSGGVRRIRKESVAKLPPMTLEAPITKVINMLVTLQESSPMPVAESLDKILEVLRSNELYAPYLSKQVRDDKMTSELVGGLMLVDEDHHYHRKMSIAKRTSCSSDKPLYNRLQSQATVLKINSPEIEALLDNEINWDFDIIQLERLTHNRPLFHLAMQTFYRFGVHEFLKVEESVICSWLHMIESNYHAANPYHNSTHAADVMHATAYFLGCERIKNIFDECDQVASLIAAVIHDLDHPGKTNSFLVNSNANLAILYNDLAVLECHHVSTAYRLTLKETDVNIFKNLPRDDYRTLRQQIVDMVLATEMTKHFEHLNRFVSVINHSPDDATEENGFDFSDPQSSERLSTIESQTLIKRMLIKCADVSNPARPLFLCVEWAQRIADEYCQQTDAEKAHNLPVVMPAFDIKACNIPRTQITFIDFFINDMFEAWTKFCGLPDIAQTLKDNYLYWKRKEDVVTEQINDRSHHINGGN